MERSKRARSRKQRKQPREVLQRRGRTMRSGSRRGGNDGAMMGSQESDGLVVPQGYRKVTPTAPTAQGGKGTTVNQVTAQLQLFRETADSPKGGTTSITADRSVGRARVLPKSRATNRTTSSTMTMEMQSVRYCPSATDFRAGIVARRAGYVARMSGSVRGAPG